MATTAAPTKVTTTMVDLDSIMLDTSIQCRERLDQGTVSDYAGSMMDGAVFPPVVLFGTAKQSWIGDGWHRIMAGRQLNEVVDLTYKASSGITADLRAGGRLDALRYALGANALNGQRRTLTDRWVAIQIALREFPELSSRAIAEMCAVDHETVEMARPVQLAEIANSKRTGRDGKKYPIRPKSKKQPTTPVVVMQEITDKVVETPQTERPVLGPPCFGMKYAQISIMHLESISSDDCEREEAFDKVQAWLDAQRLAAIEQDPPAHPGPYVPVSKWGGGFGEMRRLIVLTRTIKRKATEIRGFHLDTPKRKHEARRRCETLATIFARLSVKMVEK